MPYGHHRDVLVRHHLVGESSLRQHLLEHALHGLLLAVYGYVLLLVYGHVAEREAVCRLLLYGPEQLPGGHIPEVEAHLLRLCRYRHGQSQRHRCRRQDDFL